MLANCNAGNMVVKCTCISLLYIKGVPFSQSDVDAKIFSQVELPFQNATKVYPTTPETDAVTTATALLAKYAPPSEVVV